MSSVFSFINFLSFSIRVSFSLCKSSNEIILDPYIKQKIDKILETKSIPNMIITGNCVIGADENAIFAGALTIASGQTLSVGSGGSLIIL